MREKEDGAEEERSKEKRIGKRPFSMPSFFVTFFYATELLGEIA